MEDLLAQYRKLYPARGHKLTTVYPGVAEGLAALGGRKGTATTKGTSDDARDPRAVRPDPVLRPRTGHRRLSL